MGCDIHLFVERKENGKWKEIDCPTTEWFSQTHGIVRTANKTTPPNKPLDLEKFPRDKWSKWGNSRGMSWYSGRNYDMFALLAGVRNRNNITPLSEPRGLPEGVSETIKNEYKEWEYDAHSASYFTLTELTKINFDRQFENKGCVNEVGYRQFKEKGQPASYCQGAFGTTTKIVSNEKMDKILAGELRVPGIKYYTWVTWKESYDKMFGLKQLIKQMKKVAKDPDRIRTVFWFDN